MFISIVIKYLYSTCEVKLDEVHGLAKRLEHTLTLPA